MKALIIHLSDLHLKREANSAEAKLPFITQALRNEEVGVQLVVLVLSGDLVYEGDIKEFEHAEGMIRSVVDLVRKELKPEAVRVVAVPGNHDCVLPEEDSVRDAVIASIRTKQPGELDVNLVRHCVAAQKAFFASRDGGLGAKPDFDGGPLYWEYRIEHAGAAIIVQAFNTAWQSMRHETQGALHFPLEMIGPRTLRCDYVAAVFHHPYNWMPNVTARTFREELERTSDLIMTGHEHEPHHYQKYTHNTQVNEYLEGAVFQEHGRADKSGFHAVYLDLAAQQQRITSFVWEDGIFVRRWDGGWMSYGRGARAGRKEFELLPAFETWLDDPGTPFSHPAKVDELRLSDIYVLPNVKEFQLNRKNEFVYGNLVEGRDLLKAVGAKRNVLLFGRQQSGKSSLSKILFMEFYKSGLTPVILQGDDLGTDEVHFKAFAAKVGAQLARQFGAVSPERIGQLSRETMVVMIDDFDHTHLNAKGRVALLDMVRANYGRVIALADDAMKFEEITSGKPGSTIFSEFEHMEIVQFGHLLRSKLIERWYSIGSEYVGNQADLARRITDAERLVNNLLGKNYLPSYPIYVLSLIQAADNVGGTHTTKVGTYGSLYEALITKALTAKSSSTNLDTRLTYLSELAFHLYETEQRRLSESSLRKFHQGYCEKYQFSPSLEDLKRMFVETGILHYQDERYGFQYPAAYFYFVARYIRDNITLPEIKALIVALCDKLHLEKYASILLFLTHLSKDPYILQVVLEHARKVYADVKPSRFEDDVKFMSELTENVDQIVLDDQDFPVTKEKRLRQLDEAPELEDDLLDEEAPDDVRPMIAQIMMALRTIEVLGQVIKNFPGSLVGKDKHALVVECYGVGLRTIATLFESFQTQMDEFVDLIAGRVLEAHPDLKDRDEYKRRVKGFLFWMLEGSCFGMVKRISLAVGHPDLAQTYEAVRKEMGSTAAALIDMSIQLDHLGFPDDELQRLSKTLERESFGGRILRQLVVEHFYLFPTKESTKQKVCEALGIKIQNLRQIDAKSAKTKKMPIKAME